VCLNVSVLAKIVKAEGVLGLYSGFGVSLLGIVPYRAVQFGLFDTLNSIWFSCHDRDYHKTLGGILSRFCFAHFSIIAGEFASYPFDTIRRRMQMQMMMGDKMYTDSLDCLNHILSNEGVSGLFKGSLANVVRTIGAAFTLVVYDEVGTAFTLLK
jgi:solute carrier family 25 (adenine nucleotide translocator) protein 4/5/6/31